MQTHFGNPEHIPVKKDVYATLSEAEEKFHEAEKVISKLTSESILKRAIHKHEAEKKYEEALHDLQNARNAVKMMEEKNKYDPEIH